MHSERLPLVTAAAAAALSWLSYHLPALASIQAVSAWMSIAASAVSMITYAGRALGIFVKKGKK
jgi:hypothetical protein